MTRRQTLVQLSDELLSVLDARAARAKRSRSEIIREAIETYLHDDIEADIDRRIVEGYTRIPPSGVDEWGDLDASSDASLGETLERLDAEEREAGLEPW